MGLITGTFSNQTDLQATLNDKAASSHTHAIRELLTADRTYYVAPSPTGNDSNTGLTIGSPFATIQKAFDTVVQNLDVAGHLVTIQVADGTYSAGASHGNWTGGGSVKFLGNVSSQQNVVINSSTCFYSGGVLPGAVIIQGMKLIGGTGIRIDMPGQIQFMDMQFGAMTGNHLQAQNASATR